MKPSNMAVGAGCRPHAAAGGTEAFENALLEWLNGRLVPPGVIVGPDTPLFAGGLIDSIRVLELIAWTERTAGLTIPDRMIRMDNFGSARRIAEVFGRSGGDGSSEEGADV